MSQAGILSAGNNVNGIQTITGDSGGAVPGSGGNNINLLGTAGEIVVTGNPGTNTLTLSLDTQTLQTWTPVVTGTTIAGTGTYTSQNGFYSVIGSMVFVDCEIVWTAHTGTGQLSITGLPFPCNNTVGYSPQATIATSNITFPASCTFIEAHIPNGASAVYTFGAGSTIGTAAIDLATNTAGLIHFSLNYMM